MHIVFELSKEAAHNFEQFAAGYIECAAWAGVPDDAPADVEFTEAAKAEIRSTCAAFFMTFEGAIRAAVRNSRGAYGWANAGHDFFLTRNGHGAGFWDRENLGSYHGYDIASALSEACKMAGEHSVSYDADLGGLIND